MNVGDKIVMMCLEGAPAAKITRIDKNTGIVKARIQDRFFHIRKSDIVEGESSSIAVDFLKEDVIPDEISDDFKAVYGDRIESHEKIDLDNGRISLNRIKISADDENGSKEDAEKEPVVDIIDRSIELTKILCSAKKDEVRGMAVCNGIVAYIDVRISAHQMFDSIRKIQEVENTTEIVIMMSLLNDFEPPYKIEGPYESIYRVYYKKDGIWKYGILPFTYHGEDSSTFGEVIWDNELWKEKLHLDMLKGRVVKEKYVVGRAYHDRIIVDDYYESIDDYFYEGIIDKEKLDDDLKMFLDKYNLDINDRDKVSKLFSNNGFDIKIEEDQYGYFTVRANTLLLKGRHSMTRGYLEAVEKLHRFI